jgi:colanic acid/amylovoran biosynthesis glycosyltransferase
MGDYIFHYEELRSFMDADIVHIQFGTYKYPFDIMKAAGLFKGKLVTTFHGFDAHFTQENKAQQEGFYSELFASGDAFTVNSGYLKEKILELGCPEQKVTLIPIPVDTDYFRPAPSNSEAIRLLSVGRLTELKGHSYGIKAVHALMDKGYELRYDIVGQGEEKENLEKLIADLGLGHSVKLHDKRTQAEILNLMQDSDIYLMTSIVDRSGRGEAQGLVTGEAQACGLPVVGFKSGGVPSTLADGRTGFLVPEKDVVAMAERLAFLIDHPEERGQMGIEARKFVEQEFSLEVISWKWSELYAQVLAS